MKTRFFRNMALGWNACLAVLVLAASGTAVQAQVTSIDPFGELAPPAAEESPEEHDEEDLPRSPLAAQPGKRTPGSMLGAIAGRQHGKTTPPDESDQAKIAQFMQDFLVGDWSAIGTRLAKLPPEAAPAAYDQLLTLLASADLVLPEDVLAIADASPGDLTKEQLFQLGGLLKRASSHADAPRELLAVLTRGTARLGGDDPSKKRAAARLLLAADMFEETTHFLPPVAEALQSGDIDSLNLHGGIEWFRFRRGGDKQALGRVWDLSLTVLKSDQANDDQRDQALRHTVSLLDDMPREKGAAWLQDVFKNHPVQGTSLLALAVQNAETAYAERHPIRRQRSLNTARILADAVLDAAGEDLGAWKTQLRLLVLPWLNEAMKTAGDHKRILVVANDSEIPKLDGSLILASAPAASWMAALPQDTARLTRRLTAHFAAEAKNWELTRSLAGTISQYDVEVAREIVETYVAAFAEGDPSTAMPMEMMSQYGGLFGSVSSPFGPAMHSNRWGHFSSEGVALTRAAQVQQIEKLGQLLVQIKQAGLPAPSPETQVEAFAACHSHAEVYSPEDIERVFGTMKSLSTEVAFGIARTMRVNLASQWRAMEIQNQAGTRRTDQNVADEVRRGYELALAIVASTFEQTEQPVDARLLAGMLHFDQAEFLYGQGAALATYTSSRDRAFAYFAEAARLYAQSLSGRSPDEYSIDVYRQWFQAALGASDLAYLTRQDSADKPQIARLADAIRELGPGMADVHLALFGQSLTATLDEIPPSLKPRCLEQALVVLGSHASGQSARNLLDYYQQLLAELELHLEIDGPDDVGHGRPFGARLSLRYSQPLGREGSGFTSLLEMGTDPQTGNPIDQREKLQEEIREKLGKAFDVLQIGLHNPAVSPRSYGRRGWQETPLAYLVLAAKDSSVDKIPALQVDLAFRDAHGLVLLPIVSRPLLIDARRKDALARPVEELTIKQVLDDRELPSGKLRLEIVASGKGLIPDLVRLLPVKEGGEMSGFQAEKIEDHGLSIAELKPDGGPIRPNCERTWMVELQPPADRPVSNMDQFTFPAATDDSISVVYERYDDADIVGCERVVSIGPVRHYAIGRLAAIGTSIAAAVAALIVLVVWLWRRAVREAGEPAYARPEPLTPFSLIAMLKRMQQDARLAWNDHDRDVLATTISDLEDHYFSRGAVPIRSSELDSVLDRWWPRTRGLVAANGRT